MNQGIKLPGEWLAGDLPKDRPDQRIYFSNVCVVPAARKRGIAQQLMLAGRTVAEEWGVEDVYVHVVVDNAPAKALYERLGFEWQKEEPPELAKNLGRPGARRLLLHSAAGRIRATRAPL